jgi:hypothetical protein
MEKAMIEKAAAVTRAGTATKEVCLAVLFSSFPCVRCPPNLHFFSTSFRSKVADRPSPWSRPKRKPWLRRSREEKEVVVKAQAECVKEVEALAKLAAEKQANASCC